MAIVTGTIFDFELELMPAGTRIGFVPSGPGTSGSSLLPSRTVWAIPSAVDGTFSQVLYPNTIVQPNTWFTIRIEWPDPNYYGEGKGFIGLDLLDARLVVPAEGGTVSELLQGDSGSNLIWAGPTAPPGNPTVGSFWIDTTNGQLMRWAA